jgi:xanthine dehydrogenase accessory factor
MSVPTPIQVAGAAPDIWGTLAARLDAGRAAALATVTRTWGSSPVPVGGRMLVDADGAFIGSVSGGCVEGDVIAAAGEVIETGKPQLLEFGVEHETAWRSGLPCGGQIQIVLERFAGAGDRDLARDVAEAQRQRRPIVLASAFAGGDRRIYAPADDLPDDVAQRFERRDSAAAMIEGRDVFLGLVAPAARTVIVGATHIGQILTTYLAIAGYEVVVVDPRTAYATQARFAGTRLLTSWPKEGLTALGLDAFTALVALSHTAAIDDEALASALVSPCFYVGALGSTRNHAKRCERLRTAGFTQEQIARINAPVGLEIGARTPEEIALSIAAEIVGAFRGRKSR